MTPATTSAAEVVEALVERLRASDDRSIWLERVPDDVLRARAAALDAAPPTAAVDAPLWGVTFAVKGNIDVAGLRTTAGCPTYGEVAASSAPVVERLLAAGAILVGTTNLDQFATGLVGTRSPHGVPRNPIDADLVPGGSSSGSAVAVATGLVDVALGTDTAGSGRVPAAMCEIVGLKAAPADWPTTGVVPACRTLDCVSVFSRSLDLAGAVATVLGGRPWTPATGRMRVGVPDADTLAPCDDGALRAFHLQLDGLRAAGHELIAVDLAPFLAAGELLYGGPWVAERAAAVGEFIREHLDAVEPVVAGIILGGFEISGVDVVRGQERLDDRREAMAEVWQQVDVVVTPTVPFVPTLAEVAADPVGLNRRLGVFTHPANLLDLAVVAVPGPRRPDGRPSGASVLAPRGREAALLAAAHAASEPRRPPIPAHAADAADAPEHVEIAVVGAHLSGQRLNHQLTDREGRLVARTVTAPTYRLHVLDEPAPARPGLERVGDGGAPIEVEVWSLPVEGFGSFVAAIPPPLAIGSIQLDDGRWVKGFVCEPIGLLGADDVTRHGGWRSYLASAGD